MAAGDVIVRLLVNSEKYDKGLQSAQRELDKFVDENLNLGNVLKQGAKLMGTFAVAVGAGKGAMEAFDKLVHSSQQTGDKWDNTVSAMKGTVDIFFQSLANGDFSAFNDGIGNVIGKLKEVAALRDSLADAKLSMEFNFKEFDARFTAAEATIRDTNRPLAEREAAFEALKKETANIVKSTKETSAGAMQTILADVNARSGRNDFTEGDIRNFMSVLNNDFSTTELMQEFMAYSEKRAKAQQRIDNAYSVKASAGGAIIVGDDTKFAAAKQAMAELQAANPEMEKQWWLKTTPMQPEPKCTRTTTTAVTPKKEPQTLKNEIWNWKMH